MVCAVYAHRDGEGFSFVGLAKFFFSFYLRDVQFHPEKIVVGCVPTTTSSNYVASNAARCALNCRASI
jgi:hypothetical protein